jgi:hypothetical protein
MSKMIKRDATKRERAIRRAREQAALCATLADMTGRQAHEALAGQAQRAGARVEAWRYVPRGRRG